MRINEVTYGKLNTPLELNSKEIQCSRGKSYSMTAKITSISRSSNLRFYKCFAQTGFLWDSLTGCLSLRNRKTVRQKTREIWISTTFRIGCGGENISKLLNKISGVQKQLYFP